MSDPVNPPVAAPAPAPLSEAQLADIATLLARTVTRGNIGWLATSVLGRDALREVANELGDAATFARSIVDALNQAGRIGDAVTLLRQEAHRNSRLLVSLEYIMRGHRLDDDAEMQKFVNEYEPFFNSASIQENFSRVLRTVCAVALGSPTNAIVGSGFLIAPDLVMTNFHVLETFLRETPDGGFEAAGEGSRIYCFFDYLWQPEPRVPPANGGPPHASLMVTGHQDWLVHARPKLENDGTPDSPVDVGKKYDYAVIRLERPVGRRTARLSGGAVRGWLPLPTEELDVLGKDRRILVFQHPGKAPQQFDVGDFVQLDASGTRVWYSVSTAKGSSGGAAVDSEGKLFALHNAEVVPRPGLTEEVNQGVRIDLIAEDLRALQGWTDEPAPEEEPLAFWSLSDDPRDPRPIIGRETFRENVTAMMAPEGARLLVVTGGTGSGRGFSVKLLRRTLGTQTPVVEFSPRDVQTLGPKDFLRFLVDGLGIVGTSATPMPEPPATESVARWLRLDLPRWLADRLADDQQRNPSRYPAWVVVNAAVPEGERVLWAEYLKDFVAALVGVADPGQKALDLPQLRWLFLGNSSDAFPVSGAARFDEDLATYPESAFSGDFAHCMQVAWRSTEKRAPLLDEDFLKTMAVTLTATDPTGRPLREVLAAVVREMVLRAPGRRGQP